MTDAVVAEMQAKHPCRRLDDEARQAMLGPTPTTEPRKVGTETVLTAIRQFPKGSAAGPSGLRPQHLKDALVPGWSDEVLRALQAFADKLLVEDVHPAARPWFVGARLMALPKTDGRLRPVAVGETLRRFVAKVAFAGAKYEIVGILAPLQLGVGVSQGAEAIVHSPSVDAGRTSRRRDGRPCAHQLGLIERVQRGRPIGGFGSGSEDDALDGLLGGDMLRGHLALVARGRTLVEPARGAAGGPVGAGLVRIGNPRRGSRS